MSSSMSEDNRLKMSITHGGHTIGDVLCEVYLPKRLKDPVELIFRPTSQQSRQLGWPFEFSIYGEIKGRSGKLRTIIQASKVYYKYGSTKRWDREISESILIGEPTDLKITNFLRFDEKAEKEKTTTKSIFWITPSLMLTPAKSLSYSFTGEVVVNNIWNFEFTLENGTQLKFDHHYRYLKNNDGEMVSFPELVAEFETDTSGDKVPPFELIDDFLMLTSFSARQRCACLGWELYGASHLTRFYRRDMAIPEIKKDHSVNDALIDIQDFEEFIGIVYGNFVQTKKKDLLRQVVHRAIDRENTTVESNYLRLYSALETLVKLPEVNRVSFSTAFNEFCKFYKIDLKNLWPVVDKEDGISLSGIRNRLIHGDIFTPRQQLALMSAGAHLRWVVERSVLSVLGWPYSKSKVSPPFLANNMTMYKGWSEDRRILSESG